MTKWKPLLWTVHLSGWNGREQSGINRYFLFSSLLLFTVGLVGTLYTFHLTAGDCELIGHACMAHRCQNEAPCMQADIDMLTHESPHTPHECTNKTQMNFCVNYTQKRMHGEYKLEKKQTNQTTPHIPCSRQPNKSPKQGVKQGTESPNNLYQILLLRDCTGIFSLAVSFR